MPEEELRACHILSGNHLGKWRLAKSVSGTDAFAGVVLGGCYEDWKVAMEDADTTNAHNTEDPIEIDRVMQR